MNEWDTLLHLLPTVYTACLKSLTSCAASIESPCAVDIVRSASRSGSLGMRDARASARACAVITIPVELKGFVHNSLPNVSELCSVDPGLLLRVSLRPVEGMWVHVGFRPVFQREGERLRANGYRRWVAPRAAWRVGDLSCSRDDCIILVCSSKKC